MPHDDCQLGSISRLNTRLATSTTRTRRQASMRAKASRVQVGSVGGMA